MKKALIVAALLFSLVAVSQAANNFSVIVFNGITAPLVSAPVPNQGQGLHLLTVMFPAATGVVSGIQVRVEASYDNALYFPITLDITSTIYTGSFAYYQVRGNGAFPYVRVRAVLASMANPMTVYYTGGEQPIGNFLVAGDRFIGTPTAGYVSYSWVLCNGTPCITVTSATNKLFALSTLTFQKCSIGAKTAPTGAALIVDIQVNGTSIFSPSPLLTLTAGSVGPLSTTTFTAPAVHEDDVITLNITQIGATLAGQDVTVNCRMGI